MRRDRRKHRVSAERKYNDVELKGFGMNGTKTSGAITNKQTNKTKKESERYTF